jgi:hypothetical protein
MVFRNCVAMATSEPFTSAFAWLHIPSGTTNRTGRVARRLTPAGIDRQATLNGTSGCDVRLFLKEKPHGDRNLLVSDWSSGWQLWTINAVIFGHHSVPENWGDLGQIVAVQSSRRRHIHPAHYHVLEQLLEQGSKLGVHHITLPQIGKLGINAGHLLKLRLHDVCLQLYYEFR